MKLPLEDRYTTEELHISVGHLKGVPAMSSSSSSSSSTPSSPPPASDPSPPEPVTLEPNRELIYALNRCIEACIDGEKGYANAAADVRDETLKSVFHSYSNQRSEFVRTLQSTIEALGGFAENHGTARGTAHRGFTEARMALEGRPESVALAECERGESKALAVYDRFLASLPMDALPAPIRIMLVDQRAAIKLAHDDVLTRDLASRRAKIQHREQL